MILCFTIETLKVEGIKANKPCSHWMNQRIKFVGTRIESSSSVLPDFLLSRLNFSSDFDSHRDDDEPLPQQDGFCGWVHGMNHISISSQNIFIGPLLSSSVDGAEKHIGSAATSLNISGRNALSLPPSLALFCFFFRGFIAQSELCLAVKPNQTHIAGCLCVGSNLRQGN